MFGPKVPLSPRLAVILSMIVHEIATNAAKYGALSNDSGTVTLDWEVLEESDGRKLRMIWTETGGPPIRQKVTPSLGTELVEGFAILELKGKLRLGFPEDGADHLLEIPLEQAPVPAPPARN